MDFPKTARGISNQITRTRKYFSDYKREYGGFHDSNGSRYYLFYLCFLLGDNRRSSEYLRWYEKNFPDDIGEPVQLLCWALIVHRMGKNAEKRLAEAMLSNIYLIPVILGDKIAKVDMWHSSNYEAPEYLDYFPDRIKAEITSEDKKWIESCYISDKFQGLLKRHIDINNQLKNLSIGEERNNLVRELSYLLDDFE